MLVVSSAEAFINKVLLSLCLVNGPPFSVEVRQKQSWAKTFFICYPLEYSPLVMCFCVHFLLLWIHSCVKVSLQNVYAFLLCKNTFTTSFLLCVPKKKDWPHGRHINHPDFFFLFLFFLLLHLMHYKLRSDGWLVSYPGFLEKYFSLSTSQNPFREY